MPRPARLAGAALTILWSACLGGAPQPPPESLTAEARRIAEGALFAEQGFDALAAFEMRGLEQTYRFAVARQWKGRGVRVLSYVMEPEAYEGTSFLTLREPGEPAQLFSYADGKLRQGGAALRVGGHAPSLAAEAVVPVLPGDFRYQQRPDETLDGQACAVVDAWPVQPLRGVTHVRLHVSRADGTLLRKTYLKGGRVRRRVEYERADGVDAQGHRPTQLWRIREGERSVEIRLYNQLADPELPDVLFTPYHMRDGRFPRF